MNTTMAPMDQLRQTALEGLRRRHDYTDDLSLKKRDGGNGRGGKRGSGNGNGDGNGSGDNSDNQDGGGDGNGHGDSSNGNNGGKDGKNPGQKRPSAAANQFPSPSPSLPPPSLFPTSSASATPTTTVVISTTTTPALVPTTTSNTFISTFFSLSSTPSFSNPLETTTPPPRLGLSMPHPDDYPSSGTTVTTTMTSSMYIVPESAIASPTHTSSQQDKDNNHHLKNKHDTSGNLSPTAQHLLIAAGAIGAFIIVLAGIYFLTRMRKIDMMASLRNRKFGKGGSRGWYGWRKDDQYHISDPPPKYSGDVYPPEKDNPTQQHVEGFYTPKAMPPVATPAPAATALSRSDSGRQEMAREALLDNPAPFATSPATQPVAQSATANFYGFAAQQTSLSRLPGTQNSQSTFVSQLDPNTATQNTYLTMNTMRSMQTQDAYDPNQREPNHLSYLSSLSSGFGDGLIIPESTVVGGGRQSYRQSKAPGAGRFSWMTSNRGSRAPGYGDRDTVYTQASVDSAPRFRTINSWVAQQAGRVEREQEIPAMPAIPAPLQAGVAPMIDHQRKISEDPAFRQHPGDEIEISRGVRVPSAILDKKTGVN